MKRKIAQIWIGILIAIASIMSVWAFIYMLMQITLQMWILIGLVILAGALWIFTLWCWDILTKEDKSSAE